MKILVISMVVLCASCDENLFSTKVLEQKLNFSPSKLTEESRQQIQVISSHNIKKLRKVLLLLPYNGEDQILLNDNLKSIKFLIKKLHHAEEFEIKPALPLAGGISYGIYFCSNKLCEIKHKFYVMRSPPRLSAHNFGQGERPLIARNRIYYEFEFDKQIFIPDENSVKLFSQDNKNLELAKIIVKPTRNTIEIEIKPSQLEEGKNYYFELSRVSNFDLRETRIEQQFVVGRDELPLQERSPPGLYVSAHEIELYLKLNNDYDAEAIVYKHDNINNCLSVSCFNVFFPKLLNKNNSNLFVGHVVLDNLQPQEKYSLIVRARDNQGKVIIASAVVETLAPSEITLSEIYVDPSDKGADAQSEFIEYVNFSRYDKKISDISIMIEDSISGKNHECILVNKNSFINILSQEYLVIVGSDFQENNFNIPKNAHIIRLPQKTLCGGLSDNKPKNIKLLMGESILLDRYKGYLWSKSKGKSIQKRAIKGLDEERNYCYSPAENGPSPGAPGGQC